MNNAQWIEVTPVVEERNRNALELLRDELPDSPLYRAWLNFRFLALDDAFFDAHGLFFTPSGIFLLHLFTRRGKLEIGADLWLHTAPDGALEALDNPLHSTRQKAEKLHQLLEHCSPDTHHVPKIHPLVFITEPNLDLHVDRGAHLGLIAHPTVESLPAAPRALTTGRTPGIPELPAPLNQLVLSRFEELIDEAHLDSTTTRQRLGDYFLGDLLDTTDLYQDFLASHVKTDAPIRARVFRAPRGAATDQRERLKAAARREFAIVSELHHPNILQACGHLGHETRPTVFFDHPPGAVRLDHYLEQTPQLPAATRFKLLESIAGAIRFAHEHRVVHRALSPQSVLVVPRDRDATPEVYVHNWHTGLQEEHLTGTRHVADYLHDRSRLFLAPELAQSSHVDESADIFGLGALAYYLFTGELPARDLPDLIETLFQRGGLRLTAVRDAVSPDLDTLIFDATRANPTARISTVDGFLQRLAATRSSLVAVGARGLVDPLEAEEGTLIADRYTVQRRLGRGATATVFLATHDDRSVALKVANDDVHADRLEAEADALRKLDHPLIVDLYDTFRAGGRTILAIQFAGDTFRARLRKSRALSLDNLHRFGTDLCEICQALEAQHVFHRDIKPSNLGLADRTTRDRQHLMLFDFSLAGVSVENISVGTTAYRDPFLTTRRRWDTYADRYSAALVLYEMVTQQLPQWGDGRANPAADPDATLQLSPERFPAAIRDDLIPFFQTALARKITDRYDNATEMARAWSTVFEHTLHTDHGTETLEARIQASRPDTRIASLGSSQLAIDALDSKGIYTVTELLAVPSNDLHFIEGISGSTRSELTHLYDLLSDHFPSLTFGSSHTAHADPAGFAHLSVDDLLDHLRKKDTDFTNSVLTPRDPDQALPWADYYSLADRTDLSPPQLRAQLQDIAARWARKRTLAPLRDDIVDLIEGAGGILAATNLSLAILGKRGSLLKGRERLAAASAVTRAAVEAELVSTAPRFLIRRRHHETFIATHHGFLELLPNLGELADDYARKDPLAAPDRAYGDILDLLDRAGLDHLDQYRALSLATAASQNAALSQRNEIYPRGMSAIRALNLTANVLLRQAPLTEDKLRETVHSRYPEAQPLPDRPGLIQLLDDADIALRWNTELDEGRGAFAFAHDFTTGPALSRSTEAHSFASSTTYTSLDDASRSIDRVQERLGYKERNGGFLAITVNPALAEQAAPRLAALYNLEILSLEELLIRHLREQAASNNVQWSTLLRADSPAAGDMDRENFSFFLREYVLPAVREELLSRQGRLLLTHPGLLARWNDKASTMTLFDALRDELTSGRGPALVWVLIPGHAQRSKPHIDGAPVPVTDDSEYTRIPSPWLQEMTGP